jgi:dihydrofolate reductase
LTVFDQISLDGYFTDAKGDISWAHRNDAEWNSFVAENASGGGELVFGRITYEMMLSYWPTPAAMKDNPIVAQRMNEGPKVVFSRSLEKASWNNTKLIKGNLAGEIQKLKENSGHDLVILGSGSIVAQLAPTGLIDEYQLVVNPIILGKGRTLFDGVKERLHAALL